MIRRSDQELSGLLEEHVFRDSVERYMNIPCFKATEKVDMECHIDFFLGDVMTVDVKAQKKINSKDKKLSYDFVWVELTNKYGKPGWIFGRSSHIVFTMGNSYYFFSREYLKGFLFSRIEDDKLYTKPTGNIVPYRRYQRKGFKDEVILVRWKDLLKELTFFTITRYSHYGK